MESCLELLEQGRLNDIVRILSRLLCDVLECGGVEERTAVTLYFRQVS